MKIKAQRWAVEVESNLTGTTLTSRAFAYDDEERMLAYVRDLVRQYRGKWVSIQITGDFK
jgi:hypothetical protein